MKHALAAPSAVTAALALILAACSPEATPPADAPAPGTAATANPAPTAPGEALLEGDGFMPANPGGGTGRKPSFGEAEAVVVDFITGYAKHIAAPAEAGRGVETADQIRVNATGAGGTSYCTA